MRAIEWMEVVWKAVGEREVLLVMEGDATFGMRLAWDTRVVWRKGWNVRGGGLGWLSITESRCAGISAERNRPERNPATSSSFAALRHTGIVCPAASASYARLRHGKRERSGSSNVSCEFS